MAPDFTLPTHSEGDHNLGWYKGRKNVVLAFYPGDWTPVCSNHIPGYQKLIDSFDKLNCQVLCVSCDFIACHMAWAKAVGGLSFPLMSDYHPHGRVAKIYGVFNEERGYCERTVFLIDKEGIIRFIDRVDPAELPDNDELIRQLERLNK